MSKIFNSPLIGYLDIYPLTFPCWAFIYFLVFVIVNDDTMDILCILSYCIYVRISINYIPRCRIVASQGNAQLAVWLCQFIVMSAGKRQKIPWSSILSDICCCLLIFTNRKSVKCDLIKWS